MTALAAVAARTKHLPLVPIILAPLYDPIRLAEETALVDLISGGRLDPIIGTGYVPSEFAMFAKDLDNRVAAQEDCVEVLKRAWTGEPFPYRGTTVRVTPDRTSSPAPSSPWRACQEARRVGRLASPTASKQAKLATGSITRLSAPGSDVTPARDPEVDPPSCT